MLEPNISVKVKEELAISLMSVFHAEEMAEDVLADIVVDEISSVENEHLTFRGNSIATKAMESYIKLVGQKYLHDTLRYEYFVYCLTSNYLSIIIPNLIQPQCLELLFTLF